MRKKHAVGIRSESTLLLKSLEKSLRFARTWSKSEMVTRARCGIRGEMALSETWNPVFTNSRVFGAPQSGFVTAIGAVPSGLRHFSEQVAVTVVVHSPHRPDELSSVRNGR